MKAGIGAICAVLMIASGATALPVAIAQAQTLERFSPEYIWLHSAMPVMDGYVQMLTPIFEVTGALGYDYGGQDAYAYEVTSRVQVARERINMIHENNVWLLDILSEAPAYKRGAGGDLIRRIGDLKIHSEDIRLMSETVLRNLEASVADDEIALDTAMIEAAALMRYLSSFSQYRVEFALLADAQNHPLTQHIHRAERATADSIYLLRQAEVLSLVSYRTPELETAKKELVASVALMRRESQTAARMLEEHASYLKREGGELREYEKQLVQESLETEKVRADLVRDFEMAIYHLSSDIMEAEQFGHLMFDIRDNFLRLSPKERRSPSRRSPRPERKVNPDRVH